VKRICMFVVFFVATSLSQTVFAQSTDATINGTIMDPTGHRIQDANIEILDTATGLHYTSTSNGSGAYVFSLLPPGHYRVQISKPGFKTIVTPSIVLNVQSAVALNVTLPVGAVSESVTVEGGSSLLNTTSATVGTVVDQKFVANIPLNGRSFQDLISMTPGIVTTNPQAGGATQATGDFSVNGQRTQSNSYMVDGVSGNIGSGTTTGFGQAATSGSISASTALGTTQSLVSVDALEEFKVSSSSYSAEFGRSPGGQFSLSTRSGTNHVHGTVFDYLRNDFFDANNWFNDYSDLRKTALRQNDFGGTLGGPFVLPHLYNGTNRSFFFASYEGLLLTQPTAASAQYVPSLAVRSGTSPAIQSIFNAFPLPTGSEILVAGAPSGLAPFVGAYSLPSRIDAPSVRIDQHFADRYSLFFRFADTPTYSRARTLSVLTTRHFDTQTYTAGASAQISRSISNDLRFGYGSGRSTLNNIIDGFGGATPSDIRPTLGIPTSGGEGAISITVASVGNASVSVYDETNKIRQWNLTDVFQVTAKQHVIRFGIDQRRLHSPLSPSTPYLGAAFNSRAALIADNAYSASAENFAPSEPIFNQFSAFLQDEWKVLSTVTLSGGVRWEVNPPPGEKNGNVPYTLLGNIAQPSTLALAPHGTPLYATTWYNFAPRLGVAWIAPSHPGLETVVKAGGGVFYDTGQQEAALGFASVGFLGYKAYTNLSLPVSASLFNLPTSPTYPVPTVYAYPTHMQLPYTLEWNTSIEQALGSKQTFDITYVGSEGRRLLQTQRFVVSAQNPNFATVFFFPSGITSNYHALELKFQRSVAKGLQALVSYTWSHALDFGSTDSSYRSTYGDADFDVRNNLQGGLAWDLPSPHDVRGLTHLLQDWGVDGRLQARSAFPITLTGNLLTDSTGASYYSGVNYDPSKPIFLYGSQYPGRRVLNGGPAHTTGAAFTLPSGSAAGNAPRNFVREFDAVQANMSLRRDFALYDTLHLQFRAESFNLFNHPIFGYVDPTLSDATFGQATKTLNQSLAAVSALYQQGGPRSMQFALKLIF
jgi:hypothetical protein